MKKINNLDEELTLSFRFQNRELLDNYVILATTNTDGIITHVSAKLCITFGYKSSEIIGKPYTFLLKKEFISTFQRYFKDTKETKIIWHGTLQHSSKADELVWTETIITPLFSESEEHLGFIFASNDVSKEKILKKINEDNLLKTKHDKSILDFMPTLSSAILLKTSTGLQKLLWLISFTIIFLLIWSYFSKIDDIVKTEGKIITSTNVQNISTLNGGILKEVYVNEGDTVIKGQKIFKISDDDIKTEYDKSELRRLSLLAKIQRLKAHSNQTEIKFDKYVMSKNPKIMQNEVQLFHINQKKVKTSIRILQEQLNQIKNELYSASKKIDTLEQNKKLLLEEMAIKRPLIRQRVISKMDLFKSQKEINDINSEIKTLKINTRVQKSTIQEIRDSMIETKDSFRALANDELVTSYTELQNIDEDLKYYKEKLKDTIILSPNSGIINQIVSKTEGEAIAPGNVIAQIIPESPFLLAEIKVQPSKIGFIYVGQKVKLKLRPFDFSLYGTIDAEISYISADTLPDKLDNNNEVFIVHIKSNKKYVGTNEKLIGKPGMSVDADIITGKKSILEYVFKPIVKSLDK